MRFPHLVGKILKEPRFRALFIAVAGTLDHPVYRYGQDRLERVTEEGVRSQLHPMLSGDDRPDAATLRHDAWRVVEPFLDLTDTEREYSDKIQIGILESTLLFSDDPGVAERLNRYPPLLWKIKNARSHRRGRPRRHDSQGEG
jgi:hypothetical protein